MKIKDYFFKRMLKSHSVMGLAVSVVMYLICLTGTLAVFYPEFERWEQPQVSEYQSLSPSVMTQAMTEFYQKAPSSDKSLYIVMPTQSLPRAHISDGDSEWWLSEQGSLVEKVDSPWTQLLLELHVNLHLPKQLGLLIVGIIGVILTALIISGLFAHKRLLKDAFRLRLGGSGQQQQIDIHNRLSVWAAPFHLMIAITGAFFGIVGLLIVVASSQFYQGDRETLIKDVYGTDPVVVDQPASIDFTNAFQSLTEIAPQSEPIYLVINKPRTDEQYLEIAALPPERLIYSEMYRFDANGSYLDHQGFSDGPLSRQVIYSVYRVHFGHFGNYFVKVAYLLLGLSLTVICVTGINIWLNRRGMEDKLNVLWSATVWGTPIALTIAAISSLVSAITPLMTFLTALTLLTIVAVKIGNTRMCNLYLSKGLILAITTLLVVYGLRFYEYFFTPAAMICNALALSALVMSAKIHQGYRKKQAFESLKDVEAETTLDSQLEPTGKYQEQ